MTRRLLVGLLATLLVTRPAWAHGEDAAADAAPGDAAAPSPGWQLTWDHAHLQARQALPSQALSGYLLQGDAGTELRGTRLVHAAVGVTVQAVDGWLLHGELAQHGGDAPHAEALWARRGLHGAVTGAESGTGTASLTTITIGRQAPAQGPLWTTAGHHDRFVLMPLAKQATTLGTWLDDGVQLQWAPSSETPWGPAQHRLHIGLWQGHAFPGSRSTSGTPSLHGGTALDHASGLWTLDAWAAVARVSERGARLNLGGRGHSHVAPQCSTQPGNAPLSNVVCFSGRSTLSGWSLGWRGPEGLQPVGWPELFNAARWRLDVGQLWRQEGGQLASTNGQVDLHSRYAGQLLQAWWTGDAVEVGWRGERLMARHRVVGAGAAAVAQDAGLVGYAPVHRHTLALAWPLPTAWLGGGRAGAFSTDARVAIESGQERQGDQRVHFATVRLVIGAGGLW